MSFPAMTFTPICGAWKMQIDLLWQWTSWATKKSKILNKISLFQSCIQHLTVSSYTAQIKVHWRCATWGFQSSVITMQSILRMKPAHSKRILSLIWYRLTQEVNFWEMESISLLEITWLSKYGMFVMLRNLYRT